MKVKVTLNNGQSLIVVYQGQTNEFLDVVRFDTGTAFVEAEDGTYIMVKTITSFKFIE